MTLNVPSFFAGIGTVVVLLTLGFGGGVLMSGVISDKPREPGKVEKWAAEAQKPPAEAKAPAGAQKPPVITATPVPVAPAAPPAAPQPIVNAEPAPEPVTSTQPAPQPTPPVITPAPPAPAPMRHASPPLQEKPVALVDPAVPQPQAKPQSTKRADKRNERRKQVTERRREPQIGNAPQAQTVDRRPRQQEVDDDDDDVRAPLPFFRDREREEIRRPFFRFFGNDD